MFRNLAAAYCLALLIGACSSGASISIPIPKKSGKVVAQVNGQPITADEFRFSLDRRARILGKKVDSLTAEEQQFVLNELIEQELLFQQALQENLVTDEMLRYLRARLTREIIKKHVDDRMEDKNFSDDVVADYYEVNKNNYEIPEQIRARQILYKFSPDASDGEKKQICDKARGLLKTVRAKPSEEVFAENARKFSQDFSAPRSGDLGYFPRNRWTKEFSDVAFAVPVGKISDVFETNRGCHIVMVTDRKPVSYQPLKQVASGIRGHLQLEARQKAEKAYVASIRNHATITTEVGLIKASVAEGNAAGRSSDQKTDETTESAEQE